MRKLVPIDQLSPAYLDQLREQFEKNLLLNAGTDKYPRLVQTGDLTKLRTHLTVRTLLPWTDLGITAGGQAAATSDFWGTGALVAATPIIYTGAGAGAVLAANEFVCIYGLSAPDAAPSVHTVMLQVTAATTLAIWNTQEMWASRQPIAVSPEAGYWAGQDNCFVSVTGFVKAADARGVGDYLELLGMICMPKGAVVSV